MKDELKIIYDEFVKPVVKGSYYTAKGFFAFPTTARNLYEESLHPMVMLPTIVGASVLVTEIIAFLPVHIFLGKPESEPKSLLTFLTAHFATNAISGAYEVWRYAHDKAKVSDTTQTANPASGLEVKIQTPTVKPEAVDVVDPWKADIDESYLRIGGIK